MSCADFWKNLEFHSMKNIWIDQPSFVRPLQGRGTLRNLTVGETHGYSRSFPPGKQNQQTRAFFSSAKRINMNSRGCQPTESGPKSFDPERVIQSYLYSSPSEKRNSCCFRLENQFAPMRAFFPSAKRINVNSRGCKPTERPPSDQFGPCRAAQFFLP